MSTAKLEDSTQRPLYGERIIEESKITFIMSAKRVICVQFNEKLMDICLITIDNNLNKSLQPKTAIGMLWLQTHFENDQWEALSNSTVIISEENSQLLIEDAKNAGLNVECFSDISIMDVFPKNN